MNKKLKVLYILFIIGIAGFLLNKEYILLKEAKTQSLEKSKREELIKKEIDEKYIPRKDDFYKKKK